VTAAAPDLYALRRVQRTYRPRGGGTVHALRDVTLHVRTGECVAVIGHSGAGKSTLLRLLNGSLRPSSGVVQFAGQDLDDLPRRDLRLTQRRIGTIYQQHHLISSLSVVENTLCGALGRWSLIRSVFNRLNPRPVDLEAALEALALVGLAERSGDRTDRLSGGQQQRVAIARVLMQDPDVILADEPIASLDPHLASTIVALLVRLSDVGRKRTLIMALHDVELATTHFERIIGLRSGAVAFDLPATAASSTVLREFYKSPS
jgi:phosphonate transport system ATP-binding protein